MAAYDNTNKPQQRKGILDFVLTQNADDICSLFIELVTSVYPILIDHDHPMASSPVYSGIQLRWMVFVFINLAQKEEGALTGLIQFQPCTYRIMLFTSVQW